MFWGLILLYNYTELVAKHLKEALVAHILLDGKKSLTREDLKASAVDSLSAVDSFKCNDFLFIERRLGMTLTIEGGLYEIDLVLMLGGEGIESLPLLSPQLEENPTKLYVALEAIALAKLLLHESLCEDERNARS